MTLNDGLPSTQIQISNNLEKLCSGATFSPNILLEGNLPNIIRPRFSGIFLEASVYNGERQDVYFADSHAMIFQMLGLSVKSGRVDLPINCIINFDYHSDIAQYNEDLTTLHENSWQRAGVDKGLWKKQQSYNVRPVNSSAKPLNEFNPDKYILDVSLDKVKDLHSDVLSIDLDYFNNMEMESEEYKETLRVICTLAQYSKVIAFFSSSAWTRTLDSLRRNMIEKDLVNDVIKSVLNVVK
jgi:hypothetical protein